MDRHQEAVEALAEALSISEPGNLLRTYLDQGEPMRRLLADPALADGRFAQRLLTEFAREQPQAAPRTGPDALVTLTPREAEVLQEIARGRSNKEIEDTLFISKNTVRTHIKNLYSKLEVESRTQAIVRARELDLLPGGE